MRRAAGHTHGIPTLLAMMLALTALGIPASSPADSRLALVIGNAAYEEAPLRNPVNDARAMAATLEGLGFEVIRLENATKEQMERALVQFTSRLDDGSSGLFYYAGHGIQVRGRNYLVPVGTRLQSQQEARIESVGVDLVLDELTYAGNRLNIVILDACRNNPFERRLRGASRGLAAIDAARGTLIAYATSPGSVALDGEGRNGLYTEELLRALSRPGLKIEEVFKQVRVGVARRTNDQQIPWESSSLTGEFVFNQVSTNVPLVTTTNRQHEAVFWESAERLNMTGAYQAYLDQYPEGIFAKLAALRIDELTAGNKAATSVVATPSSESRREKPLIAVLPALGNNFGCAAADSSVADSVDTLRARMEAAGLSTSVFRYLGWNVDTNPEDLWRSEGILKKPIPELVYQHGKGLKVDGMLLVWFNVSGSVNCHGNYEIYLFDVHLEKLYRMSATDQFLISETDRLAARFLNERAVAQAVSR